MERQQRKRLRHREVVRLRGEVVRLRADLGYGFIRVEGARDHFLHMRALRAAQDWGRIREALESPGERRVTVSFLGGPALAGHRAPRASDICVEEITSARPRLPSAADLDRIAEEERARQATAEGAA